MVRATTTIAPVAGPNGIGFVVLDRTLSGGACWNDCSIQTMQRGVPFGGVGESGCKCCQ